MPRRSRSSRSGNRGLALATDRNRRVQPPTSNSALTPFLEDFHASQTLLPSYPARRGDVGAACRLRPEPRADGDLRQGLPRQERPQRGDHPAQERAAGEPQPGRSAAAAGQEPAAGRRHRLGREGAAQGAGAEGSGRAGGAGAGTGADRAGPGEEGDRGVRQGGGRRSAGQGRAADGAGQRVPRHRQCRSREHRVRGGALRQARLRACDAGPGVRQGRRAGPAGRAGAGRKRRRQGPEARRGATTEGRPAARAGRARQGDRGVSRGDRRQGRLPARLRGDRRPAGRAGQARRRGQGTGGDAEGRAQASADALPQVHARLPQEGLPGGEGGDPGRAAGGAGLPARPAAVGRNRLRAEVLCAGRGEPHQGAAAGAQRHFRAPGAGGDVPAGAAAGQGAGYAEAAARRRADRRRPRVARGRSLPAERQPGGRVALFRDGREDRPQERAGAHRGGADAPGQGRHRPRLQGTRGHRSGRYRHPRRPGADRRQHEEARLRPRADRNRRAGEEAARQSRWRRTCAAA